MRLQLDVWLVQQRVTTNVNFQSGNSGANPTGDGSDARTDDGTPTAFTQTKFDSVMQSVWTNGGEPDTCYLSPFNMNAALSFVGNNNQRANVVADNEKVVNSLSVYLTPWGQISFQPLEGGARFRCLDYAI